MAIATHGAGVLSEICERRRDIQERLIFATSNAGTQAAEALIRLGRHVLSKPLDLAEVKAVLVTMGEMVTA